MWTLNKMGFQIVVLPESFVVHLDHPSPNWAKKRHHPSIWQNWYEYVFDWQLKQSQHIPRIDEDKLSKLDFMDAARLVHGDQIVKSWALDLGLGFPSLTLNIFFSILLILLLYTRCSTTQRSTTPRKKLLSFLFVEKLHKRGEDEG